MSFSLLLASSSPYRAEMLAKLRIPFTQAAPDIDETPRTNETPSDYVLRLSVEKARALQAEHPEHWIIGSDQTCVVDGKPVGKAGQSDKAVAQLKQVQGRKITFLTGLCLLSPQGREYTLVEPFEVHFHDLSEGVLKRYVEIEQPLDCAGSFKVEGLGITLFSALSGRDTNSLVGLPLIGLCELMREAGLEPLTLAEA